jgi:hypothetical protein
MKKGKYGITTVGDMRDERAARDAKEMAAEAKIAAAKAKLDALHKEITSDPHVGVLMKKGKIFYYNSETLADIGYLEELAKRC